MRPRSCTSARRGLAYYRGRYAEHRAKMGAGSMVLKTLERPRSCARARYLAERWRAKAYAARLAFERWSQHEYAWREWLPAVWKAIIQCETRSDFSWNSGTYQGAFGFYHGSWDAFRLPGYPSEAFLATPRQQYEVALAIWRRFAFSGWGCAALRARGGRVTGELLLFDPAKTRSRCQRAGCRRFASKTVHDGAKSFQLCVVHRHDFLVHGPVPLREGAGEYDPETAAIPF